MKNERLYTDKDTQRKKQIGIAVVAIVHCFLDLLLSSFCPWFSFSLFPLFLCFLSGIHFHFKLLQQMQNLLDGH